MYYYFFNSLSSPPIQEIVDQSQVLVTIHVNILSMHKQSNKDIQSSEVFPEGYNCYRKDRKDDTHGGVFELVPDKYLSTVPPEFRVNGACELLWVKLQIQGLPDLHIGSFYRPPKTTDEAYLTTLNHSISKVVYNRNCNV